MRLKKFIATTLSASILLSPVLSSGSLLFATEPGKESKMKKLKSYPSIMQGELLLSEDDIYTQPINFDFLKSVVDIIERVCSGEVNQEDMKAFAYVGNVLLRHTSVAREMFFDRSNTVVDWVRKYKDQDSCYLYDILFYVYWIVIRFHCHISYKADTDFSQTNPILFPQSFHKDTSSYWEIMESSNFQNSVLAGLKIAECLANKVPNHFAVSSLFERLTDVVCKFLRNKGLYFEEGILNDIKLIFKTLHGSRHIPECKSESGDIGYKFCLEFQGRSFVLNRTHTLDKIQCAQLKRIFEDILKTERTMISLEKFFVKKIFVFWDEDLGMINVSEGMIVPVQSVPEKVVLKEFVPVSNMSKQKMKDFLSPFKTDLQDKAEKCKLATENSKEAEEACKEAEEACKVAEEACKVAEEACKATIVAGKSAEEIGKAAKKACQEATEACQKAKEARRMVEKINQAIGEFRKEVKKTRKAVKEAKEESEAANAVEKEAKEIETWIANAESEAANAVKIGKMLEQAAGSAKQSAKQAEKAAKQSEEEAKQAVEAAKQAEEERKQGEQKLKKEETKRKQKEQKLKKEETKRKQKEQKQKKEEEKIRKQKETAEARKKAEEELKKMFKTYGKEDVELKIEGKEGAYRVIYNSSLFEQLKDEGSDNTIEKSVMEFMVCLYEGGTKSLRENLGDKKSINLEGGGQAKHKLKDDYKGKLDEIFGTENASKFKLHKYHPNGTKKFRLVYFVNDTDKQIYVTDNIEHVEK